MNTPVVIFDGECEFCIQSLKWIQQNLQVIAHSYQSTDTHLFGLTPQQCSKSVYVIYHDKTYGGADAIALLLKLRGNTRLSTLITLSGGIGRSGYRWIASHRHTWPIRLATVIFKFANR